MAVTSARSGFGALLKRGDGGAPEVFTTVAEVVNIGETKTRLATVDATHMESPDQHMEKIPTLLESGDVTLELNYLPGDTTQNNVRNDCLNRSLRNFQITIPGSAKIVSFSAYVTECGPAFPHDGKMTQNVTLTPTGKVSIA
ncbi:MAG: hypothetical protein C4529_07040 [Deltaproteobacteria bacterium]|nr:MAG: hypothetical protein C4529_07040 [Deltaproteobacteria bacterium]